MKLGGSSHIIIYVDRAKQEVTCEFGLQVTFFLTFRWLALSGLAGENFACDFRREIVKSYGFQ